jgi:molybdenum cofactor cytidylyltransferase
MIIGVVLAAGRGERFGTDKLLRPLGGQPLVLRTLSNCLASSLDAVVVVVGEADGGVEAAVRGAFAHDSRVSVVHNPDAARGHITSLKAGLRVLPGGASAAAVLLADMPLVDAAIIDRVLDAHRATGQLTVPLCAGVWRHPRIIPAERFDDFLALGDGAGGGVIFERFRDQVTAIEAGEPWNYLDIDTPEDLARAEALLTP